MLPIYDVTPFTLLDFPGHTACIVWVSGCNMRCGYCHNPDIARSGKARVEQDDVFSFLKRRQGLLDGVVLSGGEATLYKELIPFARRIKNLGFAIKLDTNGTRPGIVRQLLAEGLLDAVALDYKAPLESFARLTKCSAWEQFSATLDLLIAQNGVSFEVRTTAHRDLLDEGAIAAILRDLEQRGFHGDFYLQNYRVAGGFMPLSSQGAALDCAQIHTPAHFSLRFRNF